MARKRTDITVHPAEGVISFFGIDGMFFVPGFPSCFKMTSYLEGGSRDLLGDLPALKKALQDPDCEGQYVHEPQCSGVGLASLTVDLTGFKDFLREEGEYSMPWIYGGYLVATNGMAVVRRPGFPGKDQPIPRALALCGGTWSQYEDGWWAGPKGMWFQHYGLDLPASACRMKQVVDIIQEVPPVEGHRLFAEEVLRLRCVKKVANPAPYTHQDVPLLYRGAASGQGEGWQSLENRGPELKSAFPLKALQQVFRRHKGEEFGFGEGINLYLSTLTISTTSGTEYLLAGVRDSS